MTKSTIALPMCLLASWLLTAAPEAQADNWARFRGPNGTGVATDRDIPVKFDEKTNLLWKVPLTGYGNSSPVVWGKRVFVQTATTSADQRLLLCLDVDSGKQLWAKSLPGKLHKVRKDSSQANSTPAVDGERVYVSFWNGTGIIVAAYDMAGTKVRERNLGAWESQHGPGASPVVYQDKVYFANDQDGASLLHAFDSKTGKTVWQA